MKLNLVLLQQMIDEKYVVVKKHPTADLFIYNYSSKTQYDKKWNEITMLTRGLILDSAMNIVARPFSKFFNWDEIQPNEIPNLPFDVFEKMDGSLGILYWNENKPYIATRGSFDSEQALHATTILHQKYEHTFAKIDKSKTYLFEIIYPENKIVVDYGTFDDLVLLTIIDNHTGLDVSVVDIGFPIVKRYDGINDLQQLTNLDDKNKEGFVVRFKNGFRVKVKFQEYKRLHRIITGISNVVIWEYLRDNRSFDELIEKVPDEFYQWLIRTKKELETNYQLICDSASVEYVKYYHSDRKSFATNVLSNSKELSGILFKIYDKKPFHEIVWKMIKPKYSKAFIVNSETI